MEAISSLQNARVKRVALLQQKSAERRRAGLFVVEGRRELAHCLEAGYSVETAYYCPEAAPAQPKESDGLHLGPDSLLYQGREVAPLCRVSAPVYAKMAYREATEGLLAVVRSRQLSLAALPLGPQPLIVVLESVEKPGNLGAVLRSADAAGADAVVVCDPLTDLYNPNLIRSSVGAVFSVPCVACTSAECIAFLQQRGISILTAQLQDSKLYYDTSMLGATAIVMGTEATGLTAQWREAAQAHIRIPMLGRIDSLNVSVSAAILLFEAVRQRQAASL